MTIWFILTSIVVAAPYELSDEGRTFHDPDKAALIVVTPGVKRDNYSLLIDKLEREGLDAWSIRFPIEAQDASLITSIWIPAALEEFDTQVTVLVGHGFGGTLAAEAVALGTASPNALAILGSPLITHPTKLSDWVAKQPIPIDPISPDMFEDITWEDKLLTALLLGEESLTLEVMSPQWVSTIQSWMTGQLNIDLTEASCPIWAGSSGMDNIAPPEWVRPKVAPSSFIRFGYLRMNRVEPDHSQLLTDSPAPRALSKWSAAQLEDIQ